MVAPRNPAFCCCRRYKVDPDLVALRIIASNANLLETNFKLDDNEFKRIKKVIVSKLEGGHSLTRNKIYSELEKTSISTSSLRGLHILHRLALEGLICFGSREGKQQTFVLRDEWLSKNKSMGHDKAFGELARRYFTSHGPAIIQDFKWWWSEGFRCTNCSGYD